MQLITFDEIIQGGVVRVKDVEIPMISVIDVIKMATGKNNNRSSEIFARISKQFPAVTEKCGIWKFPGERQRPTPVADLDTILIILQHLPGPSAQKYREIVAVKLRNAIANQDKDDGLTHIAKKTKAAKGDSFNLPGENNSTAVTEEVRVEDKLVQKDEVQLMEFELNISKIKKEKAMIDFQIVTMARDAFISISPNHELCPTSVNILKDQISNIIKVCGINLNQPKPVETETYEESPFHPITISDRVNQLGHSFDKNMLLMAGKITSKEYNKIHGKRPMKDKRMIEGAFRDINVFTNQDIPILDSAINNVIEAKKRDEKQARLDTFITYQNC